MVGVSGAFIEAGASVVRFSDIGIVAISNGGGEFSRIVPVVLPDADVVLVFSIVVLDNKDVETTVILSGDNFFCCRAIVLV